MRTEQGFSAQMTAMEPNPSKQLWPRYAPEIPWPSYRYRPGLDPHPLKHESGHLRGRILPKPEYLPPDQWRLNRPYLMGVDLFNWSYWWEAHEAWEGLWHLSHADQESAHFMKGLIQAAAALLQQHMGQASGAGRLFHRSIENLNSISLSKSESRFMGLDVLALVTNLETAQDAAPLVCRDSEPTGILIDLD